MEQSEVPSNWEELSCLSTESAMDKSVDLDLKQMLGQEINVNKDGHLVPVQNWISNLSVSCLISTVLSQINNAQKLTKTLVLPLVQLPRESVNAYRLLSHLARPLQQGPYY